MPVLTVCCALRPTPGQAAALESTVRLFTRGCNLALRVARERGEFRRFRLHQLVYRDLRELGLSANLAVQAIARVGRKKGSRARLYRPTSAAFDVRTLSVRGELVSLTTTAGRLVIPMSLGDYQRRMLAMAGSVQGGVLKKGPKGKWRICLSLRVEVPEPPARAGKVVGVDLGQKAIATLSSGIRFSGGPLKCVRLRYLTKRAEVRSRLSRPSERTRGVRRLWERLRGREARFVNHVLHALTRRIVDGLEPGDVLAIEDLKGLRGRARSRGRRERHLHSLWPYARFRSLLEYKAALKGVQVVAVDPAHTSRECPRCGQLDRRNRRSPALFRCWRCGFQHNADWVAAFNIARRAGSTGMGRCKPARILRVGSVDHPLPESPRL